MRNIIFNKKILFFIFVIISISMILGYSYINADLSSSTSVTVSGYNSLYNVIEKKSLGTDVENNIDYTQISSDSNGKGVYQYTGQARDTYDTARDTRNVYFFRGNVSDNNVIFGDICWQIIRTTSTGGVKLIYNGLPNNGKCNNTTTGRQLSSNGSYNSTNLSLSQEGYMYSNTEYIIGNKSNMNTDSNAYVFSYSVDYNESTHKYKLNTTDSAVGGTATKTITSGNWENEYSALNNNHFTCWSTDVNAECDSVSFLVFNNGSSASNGTVNTSYYIELTGGETDISSAISSMLDHNDKDSAMKSYLEDTWFPSTNIDNGKLEDVIYCNDRDYPAASLNGFQPTSGLTSYWAFNFGYNNRTSSPSLLCSRELDRFSAKTDNNTYKNDTSANGNNLLDYPIGLITADEIVLAGLAKGKTNNSFYLYTGTYWWSMSPSYFSLHGGSYIWGILQTGFFRDGGAVSANLGIRPVVSIRPDIVVTGGDGSSDTPYIVG